VPHIEDDDSIHCRPLAQAFSSAHEMAVPSTGELIIRSLVIQNLQLFKMAVSAGFLLYQQGFSMAQSGNFPPPPPNKERNTSLRRAWLEGDDSAKNGGNSLCGLSFQVNNEADN